MGTSKIGVVCLGILAAIPVSSALLSSSCKKVNLHSGRLSATREDAATDISIVIPQYCDMDDDEYEYPSPLHSIHVRSIMTDDQAKKALELAEDYAASTGRWDGPDSERHSTYATCDFPVEDAMDLQSYLENEIGFTDSVWQFLNEFYGIDYEDMTYLDFFCARYEAEESSSSSSQSATTMDRLEAHRDGSLLSFTVTLTAPDEFEGGGTFFEALKEGTGEIGDGVVRPSRAGDIVIHSGKLLHGADVVTKGSRTVIVGFVDVADWCVRPGALGDACREWGRMDVANRRYQRQLEKAGSGNGWKTNHSKWLPKATETRGRSYIQGFSPVFSSVKLRADPQFQRQRRLETEDLLLRSILLPEDECDQGPLPFEFGDDVTIIE